MLDFQEAVLQVAHHQIQSTSNESITDIILLNLHSLATLLGLSQFNLEIHFESNLTRPIYVNRLVQILEMS